MADSAARADRRRRATAATRRRRRSFAELRSLLVGPGAAAARGRCARARRSRACAPRMSADVLPQAMRLRTHDPPARACAGAAGRRRHHHSVRRNPQPLADALFPVMGPAIRKAIAAQPGGDGRIAQPYARAQPVVAVAPVALEALRTGKRFAEIVLLNTLVYRVEQVFLIDRTSGLLLQHVTEGGASRRTPTWSRGCSRPSATSCSDSFKVEDTTSPRRAPGRRLSVWIEQGPHAVLAAVIRGTAPPRSAPCCRTRSRRSTCSLADALEAFKGDAGPSRAAGPTLEACLQTQIPPRRSAPRLAPAIAAAAVVLAALVVWAGLGVRDRRAGTPISTPARRARASWSCPSSRSGGTVRRHRPARSAGARSAGVSCARRRIAPGTSTRHWAALSGARPDARARRAPATMLQPPDGVTFDLATASWSASGRAPADWIAAPRRRAPLIPGVESSRRAGRPRRRAAGPRASDASRLRRSSSGAPAVPRRTGAGCSRH